MPNFDNIQPGDNVFLLRRVRINRNSNKFFLVPNPVTKTTKTQFTIENGSRFKKSDGSQIGGNNTAWNEGDNLWGCSGRPVEDETEKMKAFENLLDKLSTSRDAASRISELCQHNILTRPSNLTEKKINQIHSILTDALSKIDKIIE